MRNVTLGVVVLFFSIAAFGIGENKRYLTLITTNDIHGSVEPKNVGSIPTGGMAFFAGVMSSIRQGLRQKHGPRGGVLLVDSGDQFQGTLLSNYDEGKLVFATLAETGFDALIPGNHDYDFGPRGWLDDRVTEQNPDKDPRGALQDLLQTTPMPFLAANVYYKHSLRDANGNAVEVNAIRCEPKTPAQIQWPRAKRLELVSPYLIKEVAGLRVAIIGLDHASTSVLTTPSNVSDLCFRDEFETYVEIWNALSKRADIFILLIHNGDSNTEKVGSDLVRKILLWNKNSLHAVSAGHTHFVNNEMIEGVPMIQSGSNGLRFGRIDLVWDVNQKKVIAEEGRHFAGVWLFQNKCDALAKPFCDDSAGLKYEGVLVQPNAKIQALIQTSRKKIEPLAERYLGDATQTLTRSRIDENTLANFISDKVKEVSGADIAMVNMGGLRDDIQKGRITYEALFRVLPFSNHGVVVGPMSVAKLFGVLKRSIQTCGAYGALMQSGLRVRFKRNCKPETVGSDPLAMLTRVEVIATGEVIYGAGGSGKKAREREFKVATFDFVAAGGDQYEEFMGLHQLADIGIVREKLAEFFLHHPVLTSGGIDNRWVNETPDSID